MQVTDGAIDAFQALEISLERIEKNAVQCMARDLRERRTAIRRCWRRGSTGNTRHADDHDAVGAEAARQLAHTIVKAPFAGIVTNVPSLQPGQYLTAAATAFNIVSTDHVWVQASPKETELTYVKPEQKVTVDVDTYPGERWAGTVDSISPASASSFSLLPAENTSGNWIKVVQRIPVKLVLDPGENKDQSLRPGMSVEPKVWIRR